MGINEIKNNYDLDDKKKKQVDAYTASFQSNGFRGSSTSTWFDRGDGKGSWRVRVITMLWKSRKKVNFKRYYTKDGWKK